mmetsp:Transcript_10029/g.9968  ORF Transcript_10029/g.9968 Transcript_10029/m.9968 type:complete len:153 (+) Transcript_10029:900-1358(+)
MLTLNQLLLQLKDFLLMKVFDHLKPLHLIHGIPKTLLVTIPHVLPLKFLQVLLGSFLLDRLLSIEVETSHYSLRGPLLERVLRVEVRGVHRSPLVQAALQVLLILELRGISVARMVVLGTHHVIISLGCDLLFEALLCVDVLFVLLVFWFGS